MIKTAIISGILLGAAHGAFVSEVQAGPYVRGEAEVKGVDGDFGKSKIQGRVGYEYENFDRVTPYVEIGGGAITPDGQDSEGFLAVEAGAKVELTENLDAKVSFENLRYDGDNNWKVKVGTKYSF